MVSNQNKEKQTIFKEETNSQQENVENKQTASGLDENLAGVLTYPLGFVTGIIFLIIEKENRFVKFHAIQSIILSLATIIISFIIGLIPLIGWIIAFLLTPIYIIIVIFLALKAYKHEMYKFPIIGDIAEKQL